MNNGRRRQRDAFDWPELQSAAALGPPTGGADHDGESGGGFVELQSRTAMEPVPFRRRGSDAAAIDALEQLKRPARRAPDMNRLTALAVPRGAGRQPHVPEHHHQQVHHDGPASAERRAVPTGAALPRVAGLGGGARRKPPAKLTPMAPSQERRHSAPLTESAEEPVPHQQHVPVHAGTAYAKPSPRDSNGKAGSRSPLRDVSPRIVAEVNDFEKHRRAAKARSAAVDARVQRVLDDIARQRQTIDRMMHDHIDEDARLERVRRVAAQKREANADVLNRLRRREQQHAERHEQLRQRRQQEPLQPMRSGVARFRPDPSQPVASIESRGTSIAFGPHPPEDSEHLQAPRHRSPNASGSVPSSTPPPLETSATGSPPRAHPDSAEHSGSPSAASSPNVVAARERLRRAEDERIAAERELRLAEQRAAAAALLATQTEATSVLDGTVTLVQQFVRARRSVRVCKLLNVAAMRKRAERERRVQLLADIGLADAAGDDDDDDDDDESLDGVGLIESETTSAGALSKSQSNASMMGRRGSRSRHVTSTSHSAGSSPEAIHATSASPHPSTGATPLPPGMLPTQAPQNNTRETGSGRDVEAPAASADESPRELRHTLSANELAYATGKGAETPTAAKEVDGAALEQPHGAPRDERATTDGSFEDEDVADADVRLEVIGAIEAAILDRLREAWQEEQTPLASIVNTGRSRRASHAQPGSPLGGGDEL